MSESSALGAFQVLLILIRKACFVEATLVGARMQQVLMHVPDAKSPQAPCHEMASSSMVLYVYVIMLKLGALHGAEYEHHLQQKAYGCLDPCLCNKLEAGIFGLLKDLFVHAALPQLRRLQTILDWFYDHLHFHSSQPKASGALLDSHASKK